LKESEKNILCIVRSTLRTQHFVALSWPCVQHGRYCTSTLLWF